jgi:hypothetical protein
MLWYCEDHDVLHIFSLKNHVLTLVCGAKYHGREFGVGLELLFLAWVFAVCSLFCNFG